MSDDKIVNISDYLPKEKVDQVVNTDEQLVKILDSTMKELLGSLDQAGINIHDADLLFDLEAIAYFILATTNKHLGVDDGRAYVLEQFKALIIKKK